jgi:hypothetical protein
MVNINTPMKFDKRETHRHSFSFPVMVTPGGEPPAAADLRDLTVKGLGLLTTHFIRPDTFLRIHVPGVDGTPAHVLPAMVRHLTAHADGRWMIGCILLRRLEEDEVRGLIEREFANSEAS